MPNRYEFNGIKFGPRAAEKQALLGRGESLYALRHVPMSDFSVLDLGGVGAPIWTDEVRVAASDAASFEALLQNSAPVTLNGVDYPRATMTKCDGKATDPVT